MSGSASMRHELDAALAGAGFRPAAGCLRRGGFAWRYDGDWAELSSPADDQQPVGLWRTFGATFTCEIPLWLLETEAQRAEGLQAPQWRDLLEWAIESRTGRVPAPGAAAPRDRSPVIAREHLSVLAGPVARNIGVAQSPSGLRLSVPLAALPETLATPRREAAESIVTTANASWRMVRIAFCAVDRAITASVDLTGAPAEWVEPLARVGVGVLRHVVKATAATLEAILDPDNPILEEVR